MYNTQSQELIPFQNVTHKDIYTELITLEYKEHHSKKKWEEKFTTIDIMWPNVWASVNNPISTEDTKTLIWEQIHLNDYNTYSYNKWHNTQQKCPLCFQMPQSKFHLTLECLMTSKLWKDLEIHLCKIHPTPVKDTEKVFGIQGCTSNVILRNWLTFLLRQCIAEHENIAYYNQKGLGNEIKIKNSFNQMVKTEVWAKYNIYLNLGREEYFKKVFAVNDHLIECNNGQWEILTLYNT